MSTNFEYLAIFSIDPKVAFKYCVVETGKNGKEVWVQMSSLSVVFPIGASPTENL